MAELTIDTTGLVHAAVTAVFEQSDPKALAEAMASTVLNGQSSTYGRNQTTVLEEIVGNAVKSVARRVIDQALQENEEAFRSRVIELCGKDIVEHAAQAFAAKVVAK